MGISLVSVFNLSWDPKSPGFMKKSPCKFYTTCKQRAVSIPLKNLFLGLTLFIALLPFPIFFVKPLKSSIKICFSSPQTLAP